MEKRGAPTAFFSAEDRKKSMAKNLQSRIAISFCFCYTNNIIPRVKEATRVISLSHIVKRYVTGETVVTALSDVSIAFRDHEFVSVLGPSGCGKTTLLNVLGGLDRYDEGDLCIGGRSTKEFKEADWNTYRNHSVGFVFQSYNLIAHQTVLSNVELALTLSGVSGEERRQRAVAALTEVGLFDQINKKPNQLSGGQMQRVAIARALVNDPEILLCDEPTGALDTATSVQVMDLLKEVSRTRLVVMVTHNPDLAERYSTRIVRLSDGAVIGDTAPFESAVGPAATETAESPAADEATKAKNDGAAGKPTKKRRSMSFLTALSLSLNNLMTKKTRTLLVSIAGSIGIIGIALILALSNGVNIYIDAVQEDTLTSYPISLTAESADYTAVLSAMVSTNGGERKTPEPNTIYVDDSINNLVKALTNVDRNHLAEFDDYLTAHWEEYKDDATAVQRTYDMKLQIYRSTDKYGLLQVNPSPAVTQFSEQFSAPGVFSDMTDISIFSEIMPGKNGELINPTVYDQYDLVSGKWPEKADELILVVDKNNTVTNLTLYTLGVCDPEELTAMMLAMMTGEPYEPHTEEMRFAYDDFVGMTMNLVYNSDYYEQTADLYEANGENLPVWRDRRDDENFDPAALFAGGMELKVVGIVAPRKGAAATSIQGSIAYTSALTAAVLGRINDSAVVRQQLAAPTHDVFTGLPFVIDDAETLSDAEKAEKLSAYFASLDDAGKAEAYTAIRTEITEERMRTMLATVAEVMDTPDKKRDFLVSLYGFSRGQGSLASGSANLAAAAVLHAMDPDHTLDYYTARVPYFQGMFGLDGVALTPGSEPYDTYMGLINILYPTDEKLNRAFDSMTTSVINAFNTMEKTAAIENELLPPNQIEPAIGGGPHYRDYLAAKSVQYASPEEKKAYLMLYAYNALPADVVENYVNGLSDDELNAQFIKALYNEYRSNLTNDEDFKNAAVAARFVEYYEGLTEAELAGLYRNHMQKSDSTLTKNLQLLGASAGHDALRAINIYPVDFAAKERWQQRIKDYNAGVDEEDQIKYTDLVGIIMSSVTTIINAISYVLIAFVSISLVVSSIMIGIITYISVLERTKEIGILRAIGASKRDISRVFNAETLIIGFAAGVIGILATVLLCLPVNLIIHAASGIKQINAVLPWLGGLVLIAVSMVLTLIAGLIPSRIAAKKDPVIALRTE